MVSNMKECDNNTKTPIDPQKDSEPSVPMTPKRLRFRREPQTAEAPAARERQLCRLRHRSRPPRKNSVLPWALHWCSVARLRGFLYALGLCFWGLGFRCFSLTTGHGQTSIKVSWWAMGYISGATCCCRGSKIISRSRGRREPPGRRYGYLRPRNLLETL